MTTTRPQRNPTNPYNRFRFLLFICVTPSSGQSEPSPKPASSREESYTLSGRHVNRARYNAVSDCDVPINRLTARMKNPVPSRLRARESVADATIIPPIP
jgi:hypothetical protein